MPFDDFGDDVDGGALIGRGGVTTVALSTPFPSELPSILNVVPTLSLLKFNLLVVLAVDGVVGLLAGGIGGRFLRGEDVDLGNMFWMIWFLSAASETVASALSRLRKNDRRCGMAVDELELETLDGVMKSSCNIVLAVDDPGTEGSSRIDEGILPLTGVVTEEAASPR